MQNNLIKVCYEGTEGNSDVKTLMIDDILYISLIDVQTALNKENRNLNDSHVSKSIIGVIKGRLKELEEDEFTYIFNENLTHLDQQELFVTQPGLFRILSYDNSAAGKKFQRWLYHEVVPSIMKYGMFPPPLVNQESDVMKIAKTLVLEIEERERLERETKERFEKHEKVIKTISSKLASLEKEAPGVTFSSVSKYCQNENLDNIDLQYLFGWCFKICTENAEPTVKTIEDNEEVLLFPIHVISQAVRDINQKNNR